MRQVGGSFTGGTVTGNIGKHVPVVAVTRQKATPAQAGGDTLPDLSQSVTEGLIEDSLATESTGGDSARKQEPEHLPPVL